MKTMKYVVLGMALTALCCKGLSASQPNCAADRSKLIVASDFNYPPFEYQNNGTLTGFDISVACELIKRLGYGSLEVVDIPRPQQNADLDLGRVNLVVSARSVLTSFNPMTANPAAVIYANDSSSMLFNFDAGPNITSQNVLTVLNQSGDNIIGVLEGTREAAIIAEYANIQTVQYNNYEAAVTDLQDAEIDALFLQGSVATYTAETSGVVGSFLTNVAVPANQQTQGLGILVKANCCSLYASVHQAIADMIADGTLAALGAKFSVPVVQPFANLTPPDCAVVGANLLSRNPTANFIYNKYCPCNPVVVPVSVPAPYAVDATVQAAAVKTPVAKSSKEIKSEKKLEVINRMRVEASAKIHDVLKENNEQSVVKSDMKHEAIVAEENAARTSPVIVPTTVQVSSDNDDLSQERKAKKSAKSREAEMRAAEQKRKAAYLARKERKKESGE